MLALTMFTGCGGGKKTAAPGSPAATKAADVKAVDPVNVRFGTVAVRAQRIAGTDIKYNTKVFVAGAGDKLYVSRDLNSATTGVISAYTLQKGIATLDQTVGKNGEIRLKSSSLGAIAASPNGSLIYMDNGFNILKKGKVDNADGDKIKKNPKLTFTLDDVLVSTGKYEGENKEGDLQFVMAYSKDKALMGLVENGKVSDPSASDFPKELREKVFKGGLYEFGIDNGEDIYASGKLTPDGHVVIAYIENDRAKMRYGANLNAVQAWALTNKYVVACDGPINFYLWDKATGALLGKVANQNICNGVAGRVLQMYASGNTVYFVYRAEKDKNPGKDVPVSIYTLNF